MPPTKETNSISCKAAVCWGPGEPLTVEEIVVSPPHAGEVRLRIICASICHSDIIVSQGLPPVAFPRVLGHEGVGVVESVGEGVTQVKVGDVVIPTFNGECKECSTCSTGKTNICLKYPLIMNGFMKDQTARMTLASGAGILHQMFSCSTFAEFTVVDANYVVPVDSRLSPPLASLLSCGFTTGFGAPWKEAHVEKGSTVVVFGLGGVGIGAVASARCRGARKIIGVDVNQKKKAVAEVFGMTDFINPAELPEGKTVAEAVKEVAGGLGVDYSFECSGAPSLLNESINSTKMGTGMTVLLGVHKNPVLPIDTMALIATNRTMKGSNFGGVRPHSDLPTLFAECVTKEIPLKELVTHRVRLDDINQALVFLKQPECVKVLIEIDPEAAQLQENQHA